MESILRNSLIALAENNLTLVELPLLLSDSLVRKGILKKVKNPTCRQRFKEYDSLRPATRREWVESTLNKVNAFLSDRRIRQIFTSKRTSFYLYIDEFQNFATQSFIETLSEARKYRLSLILAHQNLSQLPKKLQASVLANCGVVSCFRVSREDAQIMAKELLTPLYKLPPGWEINIQELQELPQRYCFVKNKAEGGVIVIYTPDVPYPWQLPPQARGELVGGDTEEEFKETIKEAQIGVKYFKDRKKIAREHKRRLEKLTAIKEPKTFREPKR
ncbi:unnamed protein product [marine sediment metagenome]|uniref:TraD/TraG TraM recognition site domain-containing protein n=1 Tax=marine sediment metagenome TaxID=412755 RepID=X0YXV6_9ZZZZ